MKKFLVFLMVFVMLFSCTNVYAEKLEETDYKTCISGDITLNLNDEWQPGLRPQIQHMLLPPDVVYVQVFADVHIKGNTDADSLVIQSALSSNMNEKIEIDDNGNFDQEVRLILNSFSSSEDTINYVARIIAEKGDKTLIAKIGKGELETDLLKEANESLDQNNDGTISALDLALLNQSYLDLFRSEYNQMQEQENINAYIYNEWYMRDYVMENDEIAFTSQLHFRAKTDATIVVLDLNTKGSAENYKYFPDITGGIDEIKEISRVVPVPESTNVAVYGTIRAVKGNREIELKSNLEFREADNSLVGDVDGNGEVNSIDFMYVRKYIMGLIDKFPLESGFYCADVDDSKAINALDFGAMRQYLLGMRKEFSKKSNNVDPDTTMPTPTPPVTDTQTQTPTPGTGMVTYYYVNNIDVGKNPGVNIYVDKSPESKVWVSATTVCNGPLYADGWGMTSFKLEGTAINGVDYEAIDFDYFWREIGYGFMETGSDNPKRGFYITPIDTGSNEPKYVEVYFGSSTEPSAIIHLVKKSNVEEVGKDFVEANTQFAASLFQKLSEEDAEKNIFFSPFSISMALSMPYQGAQTTTKEAMAKALDYTGIDTEEINQSYMDHLNYYKNLDPQYTLDVANSIV